MSLLIFANQLYQGPLIPETTDPFIAMGNMLYLVAISSIFSFLFVWIIKKRMIKFLYFIAGVKAILCGALVWITVLLLSTEITFEQETLVTGLSILVMVISYASFIKDWKMVSIAISLWLTGASAFLIKVMFSDVAVGVLLIGFSLFDIYDVFKGPLKHLAQSTHGKVVAPLLLRVGSIEVGLGDVLFYSLSVGFAYSSGGIFIAVLALISLKIGIWVTLKLLEKHRMLPGLPIPVLLSVSVTSLSLLLARVFYLFP
ncbi:MAG: hypothetical protein QXJ17_05330 [Nitrososphaeria archaeon]